MKAEKAANIALENDELTGRKIAQARVLGLRITKHTPKFNTYQFIVVRKKQANLTRKACSYLKSRYALGSSIFRNGKTSLNPTTETALQAAYILETKGSQYRQGYGGTMTTTAVYGHIRL